MFWRGTEFFLESTGKCGIVPETAGITGFGYAHSVLYLCFGGQQTFFADIGADGIACFRFKQVHQIRAAYKKALRQIIHSYFFPQMGIDIIHYSGYFLIGNFIFQVIHMIV